MRKPQITLRNGGAIPVSTWPAAGGVAYHTQRLVMGSLHALSAYGSVEKLNMDTLDTDIAFQDDTLATADTTENEFVIKVAGDYEVNGMVNIDCNNTTGYYGGSYVYVNDVYALGIFRAYKLSSGRILSCQGDLTGLAVDDVVDLRGYVQSGNSRKNFQAGTNFWLTLKAEA